MATPDIAEVEQIADPVHHDGGTTAGEGKRMFRKYLDACIRYEASDLIVKVDLPPRIRVRGVRRDGIDKIKALQKEGEITEDDMHRDDKEIQNLTVDRDLDEVVVRSDQLFRRDALLSHRQVLRDADLV